MTRTYHARISVQGADAGLALGMSARVSIEDDTAPRKGYTVPVSAIHARGSEPQVWLVDLDKEGGATVRSQTVMTRGFSDDELLVESGLKPGDLVVTAGAQLLRPGQKVRTDEAPPPSARRGGP